MPAAVRAGVVRAGAAEAEEEEEVAVEEGLRRFLPSTLTAVAVVEVAVEDRLLRFLPSVAAEAVEAESPIAVRLPKSPPSAVAVVEEVAGRDRMRSSHLAAAVEEEEAAVAAAAMTRRSMHCSAAAEQQQRGPGSVRHFGAPVFDSRVQDGVCVCVLGREVPSCLLCVRGVCSSGDEYR